MNFGSSGFRALGLTLDHVGIATANLEDASRPYMLLGLNPDGEDETLPEQGVRVRAFRVGESLLELLEPTATHSPIARFIEKRGAGLHHVAFRVDDLEREIARLTESDAPFLADKPSAGRHGTRVIFLHPKWAGGVLVELVEHP